MTRRYHYRSPRTRRPHSVHIPRVRMPRVYSSRRYSYRPRATIYISPENGKVLNFFLILFVIVIPTVLSCFAVSAYLGFFCLVGAFIFTAYYLSEFQGEKRIIAASPVSAPISVLLKKDASGLAVTIPLSFTEEEEMKFTLNDAGETRLHELARQAKFKASEDTGELWKMLPVKNKQGQTPLHVAIDLKNSAFTEALRDALKPYQNLEKPSWLKASVTTKDSAGLTWPEKLASVSDGKLSAESPLGWILNKAKFDLINQVIQGDENPKVLTALMKLIDFGEEEVSFIAISALIRKGREETLRWLFSEAKLAEPTKTICDPKSGVSASLLEIAVTAENLEGVKLLIEEYGVTPVPELAKHCKDRRIPDYLRSLGVGERGIAVQLRASLHRLVNVQWFSKAFAFDLDLFLKDQRSRIKVFHGPSCTGKTEIAQRLCGLRSGIPGLKDLGLTTFYLTGIEGELQVRQIVEKVNGPTLIFIDEADKFLDPGSPRYRQEEALKFTTLVVTLFELKSIYWVLMGTFTNLGKNGSALAEGLTGAYGSEFGTRVDDDWKFPSWTLESLMEACRLGVARRKVEYDDEALAVVVRKAFDTGGGVRAFDNEEQKLMRFTRLKNSGPELRISREIVTEYYGRQ